jgi:hypothetical protein
VEKEMNVIGYLLVALGLADYATWVFGVDLYAFFGIYLSDDLYFWSAASAVGVGSLLIIIDWYTNKRKELDSNIQNYLNSSEILISSAPINIRKGGIFGPIEEGVLFITNKRVLYTKLADVKSGVSHLVENEIIDIDLDISSIDKVVNGINSIIIIVKDRQFKFNTMPFAAKKIALVIREQMAGVHVGFMGQPA